MEDSKKETMNINDTQFSIKIVDNEDRKQKKHSKKKQEDEHEDEQSEEPMDEIKEAEIPELDYKEDEVEAKRKRLMIISRYKNSKRFGSWLKTQGFEFNTKSLKDKSSDELENMINDIRFCISTKNTNNMYETGATKGILVLENLLRPVYKVDGLSQVLSSDPMYLDLVEELLLERANYIYVKPEYRLLYCVLSSAYIVHSQHIMLEKLSQTDEGKKMIQNMANQIQTKEGGQQPGQSKPISLPVISSGNIEVKELNEQFMKKYHDLL